MKRWVLLLATSAALGACGDTNMMGTDDSGADAQGAETTADAREAGVDAGADARPDAAPEAAVDAAPESSTEASTDSALDATPEASAEAGVDASMDAAVDAAADVRPDVAAEAAVEAAVDAVAEAAVDAAREAGVDAGAEAAADAAVEAAADATSTGDGGTATPTEFWVLRVGDGTAALTNSATAVFLERRSLSTGMLVSTVALPVAMSGTNNPLTLSGTATSEGMLARSADGRYVTLAGYAATPGTATISTSTVPRVVARVDAAGAVLTNTTLGTAYSANNVRGAVTSDGSAFWISGTAATTAGGIQYATLGSATATQILGTPSNTRAVAIFEGQLYGTSVTAPTPNVFAVGTGLPTASGATATSLPGMPVTSGPSPYGFALVGGNRLYVADDRAIASGGGVQVWTLSAGTWSLRTTFSTGASGARGVAAYAMGSSVMVLASTAETTARVVSFVDDGVVTSPTATALATAGTNTTYRGLALGAQ